MISQASSGHWSEVERIVAERTRELEKSQAAALKIAEDAVRNSQLMERAYQDLKREAAEQHKVEEQYREQVSQLQRSQRMESVGRLASGIAHDMNNILAPILLSAFMLRRSLPAEEFERTLANIEISAKRGADLVKQLLAFGRGAGGQRELVRIGRIVGDMEKLIHGTFPKNITFTATTPTGEPWALMGDVTQLHQVLLNLCVNARDAMPNGGSLSLEVKNVRLDEHYLAMHAEAEASPGPYLCMRVVDSGQGMPPEVMDRIFDPFFTTKENGHGTGLGLATVLGIVKGHQGFVILTSAVGVGTTFEIYLPASPDAVLNAAAAAPPMLQRGQGEMILVVDDEPGIRDVLTKTLAQYGYRVISAGDGIEAIVMYSQHRTEIKAVLTDIMMPFMDGVTMTRALKRMDPEVKVIASSGIGNNKEKGEKTAEMNALGVTHFLSKPYTAAEILNAIGGMLAEASASSGPPKIPVHDLGAITVW